jgi:hypothetical protein
VILVDFFRTEIISYFAHSRMRQIKERVAIKLAPKLHESAMRTNYVLFWLVEFLTGLQIEI